MAAFSDKEFRREFCMFAALAVGIAALIIATLNFSHNLGYWSRGNIALPTADQAQPFKPGDKSGGAAPPEGSVMQWLLLVLSSGSIITVGVLYYLGRRHVAYGPKRETKEETPVAARLEIAGIWENANVAHEQVIYGTATADVSPKAIELRVFAGGMWHTQGKATESSGGKWQHTCYFGRPDSPAGSKYKLVAIVPKAALAPKIAELPDDVLKSEVLSVIRSTPAKPQELPNIQTVHTWVVDGASDKYPLKIRFQMKNTSFKCADVTMHGYSLTNPLISKQVVSEVLQLKANNSKWLPEPDGVPQIAVLPGHEFRGWIAANNEIFKKEHIDKLIGNLGCVTLLVNGSVIEVKI
jgi:hypothetical protein